MIFLKTKEKNAFKIKELTFNVIFHTQSNDQSSVK